MNIKKTISIAIASVLAFSTLAIGGATVAFADTTDKQASQQPKIRAAVAESCFTYAKSVWVDDLGLTWEGSGNDPNGPALYKSWSGSKTTSKPTSVNVPCIVIYTGGSDGHTAIITEYDSATGKYHYLDYNGKKSNDYDERWLTSDGVATLFNTRTYKGICY